MPKLSRADISELVNAASRAVTDWETSNDSASYVRWRGSQRKAISEEIATRWGELVVAVADNDSIADEARSLVIAIDKFDGELFKWEDGLARMPEDTDPTGPSSLWAAWNEVIRESSRAIVRKLPSPIRELVQVQKVPDRQIAIQYGWFRADGSPDTSKVREELESPGTHFDVATWVHPSERRREQQVAEVWAARQSRWSTERGRAEKRKAPEELDDLIFQGVGSVQIARMKGIEVEEVKARASYLGVAIDGSIPTVPFSPADRQAAIRAEEDEKRAALKKQMEPVPYPEQKRLPEKIAAMAADGMSPAEIVETLSPHFPSVSPEKVLRVMEEANSPTV